MYLVWSVMKKEIVVQLFFPCSYLFYHHNYTVISYRTSLILVVYWIPGEPISEKETRWRWIWLSMMLTEGQYKHCSTGSTKKLTRARPRPSSVHILLLTSGMYHSKTYLELTTNNLHTLLPMIHHCFLPVAVATGNLEGIVSWKLFQTRDPLSLWSNGPTC
jgi:hypothetical protein